MAEPWTTPADDQEGGPPRPFDRKALEATLADAVRTAETLEPDAEAAAAAPPPASPSPEIDLDKPLQSSGPRPAPPIARPPAPPRPAASEDQGGRAVARPLNPFSSPAAGPAAPGAAASPPAPGRPSPSLLGGGPGSITAPASGGLGGGLRSTTPGNLGPINFSGTGDLLGGRAVSGLASAPAAEQPTIPLRRRQPMDPPPATKQAESAPPPPSTPATPRPVAAIEAWLPSDDDILPKLRARRGRSFRRSR